MDVAALDLGSNSFHSLIARVSASRIEKLASQKHVLKLGAHVLTGGKLPRPVFEQALEAVGSMVAHARSYGAHLAVVGTSALRDAENGAEFARAARAKTGVTVEIVSGDLEARLVYEGARSRLTNAPGRIGVIDIGGGSVEIAVGRGGPSPAIESLPLGFLRFGVGASAAEIAARVERAIGAHREALDSARRLAPDTWVFCGGTARAFGRAAARVAQADPSRLAASVVRDVASFLSHGSPAELRLEADVDATRLESIGAGATVLRALVDALGAESIAISSGGLREGIVLRAAGLLPVVQPERSRPRLEPELLGV